MLLPEPFASAHDPVLPGFDPPADVAEHVPRAEPDVRARTTSTRSVRCVLSGTGAALPLRRGRREVAARIAVADAGSTSACAPRVADADDPAAVEPHDPIDRGGQVVFDVRGADERDARRYALEQGRELDARRAVESARGLVEQQNRRVERDAARDQDTALLAARELEEAALREMRDAELAHRRERVACARAASGRRRGTSVR